MDTKRWRGVGKRFWEGFRRRRAASRRRFQLELLESRWVFDGDLGSLADQPVTSDASVPLGSLATEVAIVAEGVIGDEVGLELASSGTLQTKSGEAGGIALMTAMAFSEDWVDYAALPDEGGFSCGSVDASATVDPSLAALLPAFANIDLDHLTDPIQVDPIEVEQTSDSWVGEVPPSASLVGEPSADSVPVEVSPADGVLLETQETATEPTAAEQSAVEPTGAEAPLAFETSGWVVDDLTELQYEIVDAYDQKVLLDLLMAAEESSGSVEPCGVLATVTAWAASEGWTEEWSTTEFEQADEWLDGTSTFDSSEAPVDENGLPLSPPFMLRTTQQWLKDPSGTEEDASSEIGSESVPIEEDFTLYAFNMPTEDGGEPIALPMLFTKTSSEDGTNLDEPTFRGIASEEDGIVYALGVPVDESGEPLLTSAPTDGDAELFVTSQPMSGSADIEMVNWVLTSWGWTGVEPSEVDLWAQASGEDAQEVHTLALDGAEWDFVVVDGEPQFLPTGDNLFHNLQLPEDTNGDGEPTPIDILVIYNYLNAGHFHQLPNRVHQPESIRYVDVDGSRTVSLEDAEALNTVLTSGEATSRVEGASNNTASAARLAAPAAPVIEGTLPTIDLPPLAEDALVSEDGLVSEDALVPADDIVSENAATSDDATAKAAAAGGILLPEENGPDGSETGGVSNGLSIVELPAVESIPGGMAAFDHATVMLAADATSFPVIDVDYSANDTIVNGTFVGVGESGWGHVEWIADAGAEGRPVLRYTPGPDFSGHDSFAYTVADEEGFEWTGHVYDQIEQDRSAFSPFTVTAPTEPLTLTGESLDFVSAEGEPLLRVGYEGLAAATGSLFLTWVSSLEEGGQEVFAGSLSLRDEMADLEGWNSLTNGSAWVTGTIDDLNAALANLVYTPAQGFTAPSGVSLVVYAALNSSLGLYVNDTFASMEVIVPAVPGGPVAVGDSFTLEGSATEFRLDVLANDLPATDAADSILELAGFTPSPYSPAVIHLDAEAGQVVYQVDSGSRVHDTFAYLLRDSQGRVSQGQVTIALNVAGKFEPEESLVVVEEGVVESFEDDLLTAGTSQDEAS